MSTVPRKRSRFGDVLLRKGLLSIDQLHEALAQQQRAGGSLARALLDLKLLEEAQVLEALSAYLALPVVDLRQAQLEPDLVQLLPEEQARRHKAIVLRRAPDGLLVGMVDPTDVFAVDELNRTLDRALHFALVREAELVQAIETVYRRTDEIVSLAEELGQEMSASGLGAGQLSAEEQAAINDAPVVRLLHSIFEDAVQVHASDIHIEPEANLLRVRQRIDGFLHEQVIEETRIASALVTRLKLMSGLDISERRLPQDGRFNIKIKNCPIDVRVSTMPVQYGESIVMRLLDQSANLLSLDQLGMPPAMLERIERLLERPHGMLLVTGPTGSGKTTSLYAALNRMNVPQTKIVTVEDPVEYRLPRVNQVQVNTKIELSFARVLRSVLRQDPDVIMVGEIRDVETAEIAVRAAITGHVVLSTLHTNDSISTVSRLLDMGVPGFMVATAINAVVAQRLVRRICESCAQPAEPQDSERVWLRALGVSADGARFRRGSGCSYCNHSGYRGRLGLYEMLDFDPELTDLLREQNYREFAVRARRAPLYRPLALAGLEHALNGMTTVSEVVRVTGLMDEPGQAFSVLQPREPAVRMAAGA